MDAQIYCHIPRHKFPQFNDILKQTGGRYIRNPIICTDVVLVHYIPGEHTEEYYLRVTTNIVEKKSGWYKKFIRKVLSIVRR